MNRIKFGTRDSGDWAGAPAAAWTVEELTWRAKGGPDLGWIRAPVKADSLDKWLDLLRRQVEVYEGERLAWWGYVSTVEIWSGVSMVSYTVDDMANKIKVRYLGITDQTEVITTLSDSTLTHMYGEKELFVEMGAGSTASSLALARAYLKRYNHTRGPWKTGITNNPGTYIRVGLRGWWYTLGWRVFLDEGKGNLMPNDAMPRNTGFSIGTTAFQKVFQKVFEEANNYPAWTPLSIELPLQIAAGPVADTLKVSLYGLDVNNLPAGNPLDTLNITVTNIGTYATYLAEFSKTARISGGMKYGIVLERTGALNNTYYYAVGATNPTAVQSEYQPLMYWNGSSWVERVPTTHVNISILGGFDSAELAGYFGGSTLGGQLLNGYQVDDLSGVYGVTAPDRVYNYRQNIEDLLNRGTVTNGMLNAEVSPERILRIYKAAEQSVSDILVDTRGHFWDGSGRILGMADRIAGRWARLGAWTDAPAMFAEVVKYDGKSGMLSIAPR